MVLLAHPNRSCRRACLADLGTHFESGATLYIGNFFKKMGQLSSYTNRLNSEKYMKTPKLPVRFPNFRFEPMNPILVYFLETPSFYLGVFIPFLQIHTATIYFSSSSVMNMNLYLHWSMIDYGSVHHVAVGTHIIWSISLPPLLQPWSSASFESLC